MGRVLPRTRIRPFAALRWRRAAVSTRTRPQPSGADMRVRPWPLLLVLAALPALAAPVPDWVRESDAAARPMLEVIARFGPEGAQRIGVDGVDDKTVDLGPGYSERYRAALEAAAKELEATLPATRD